MIKRKSLRRKASYFGLLTFEGPREYPMKTTGGRLDRSPEGKEQSAWRLKYE